uniref:LsmAD domain-containing protein n=1 Tax=Araucaria cunninghamii TaxID=56994 RepID=A0A0D6QRJ7_ARACU
MSQQHTIQQRSAAVNGFDNHKTERDFSSHYNNSLVQPARFNSGNSHNKGTSHIDYDNMRTDNAHCNTINNRPREGIASINRSGGHGRPLQDRFVFVMACLIGQHVDVQVKNGSIFSGIFHSTNIDKDYGVVLKMARLIKDGSAKGGKFDPASKAPIKNMIIWANDLVQVIAKDVPLMGDELANGYARGNRHEILTDSLLSHSHHLDLERELEPWTPEKDAPESLGLEDTFQNPWNRNWDQFETNKTLFGVESTFDEELYTTKLEKGPQTKDLEREAARIAREIEGWSTRNIHLAEERGTWFSEEGNSLDEESMYSSVLRKGDDDIGEDNEDEDTDNHNEETFGVDSDYTGVAPPVHIDKKNEHFWCYSF